MIPYDDLVAALAAWRARKGQPASASPAAKPAVARTRSAPMAAATPLTRATPTSMAAVTPLTRATPTSMAAATQDETLDVDAGALLDEQGGDFAMSFNADDDLGEATAIGGAPAPRPAGGNRPPPRRGGR
jgi:hypothetical protein